MPITIKTLPHTIDIYEATIVKQDDGSPKKIWTKRDEDHVCFIQPMVDLPSVENMRIDYNCDVYFADDPQVDVQEVEYKLVYLRPSGVFEVHEVRESINLCHLNRVWQIRTYFRVWKRLPEELPP